MKEKVVIRNSHHGLTKSKPCLADLIAFYAEMSGFVGEGRAVDVIYLDFSKAFDTVLHHVLVPKIRCYSLEAEQLDSKITGWVVGLRGWWLMDHTLTGGLTSGALQDLSLDLACLTFS